MASAFEGIINEAMAELEKQRANLVSVQRNVAQVTGFAEAKRRQLSVRVDARGDIIELKFIGQGYRLLSPTELASTIVDTIRRARQDARNRLHESMAQSMPGAAKLSAVASGEVDWTESLEETLTIPEPLMNMLRMIGTEDDEDAGPTAAAPRRRREG
jgi:YbaB/EbfC DNA-binding family protein